jgi:integrase
MLCPDYTRDYTRAMKTKKKPYPDFPLFKHQTGQWAKKVRGRLHYFGTDADAALAKWLDERDDLMAGRTPRRHKGEATIRDLVNRFLTAKRTLVDAGELSHKTWNTYYSTCEGLIDQWGKTRPAESLTSEDFEKLRADRAKRFGPVSLANHIQHVRTLFKFAWEEGIIEKPVRFGSVFKKPSRKAMRRARHEAGSKLLEAAEVRKLLAAATVPMRAMILLGVNCGFGQTDLANLPIKALDLKGGWADYPRAKTAVPRRCPLWPETVKALRAAIRERPKPSDPADAGLVFVTARGGNRWVRVAPKAGEHGRERPSVVTDSVAVEFGRLLDATGLHRRGVGFYALRHTFRTVADRSKDQPAIDHIMGHARDDMASAYRERIDDDRLDAVVKVVHDWLWPKPAEAKK